MKGSEKMQKKDIPLKTPLSEFDKSPIKISAFYFYDNLLDPKNLRNSLTQTLKDIPLLSSIIQEIDHVKYFVHADHNGIEITTKEIDEKELFEVCVPNNDGLISSKELSTLYKYIQPIKKTNTETDKLSSPPLLKITLLLQKRLNKSILYISINQAVADRQSLIMFMEHWCTGGEGKAVYFDFNRENLEPITDFDEKRISSELRNMLSVYHPYWEVPKNEARSKLIHAYDCVKRVIYFSPDKISEMKQNVNIVKSTECSGYDCVYAHLWKLHATLGTEFKEGSNVPLLIDLDFRSRIEGLGTNYFGNGSLNITLRKKKKKLVNAEFSDLVEYIKDSIESVNTKTVRTAASFKKKYPGIALWTNQSLIIGNLKMHDISRLNFGNVKCTRYIIPTFSSRQLWLVNEIENGGINVKATFEKSQWNMIKDLDLTSPKVFGEIKLLLDAEKAFKHKMKSDKEKLDLNTSDHNENDQFKLPSRGCGVSSGIEAASSFKEA
jgi:hypothetical protein